MTLTLFKGLALLFGGRKTASYRSDLMTWAKTEYRNDSEWAYYYMLENGGTAPKAYEGIYKR